MRHSLSRLVLPLLAALLVAGCKAGPSAFDRSRSDSAAHAGRAAPADSSTASKPSSRPVAERGGSADPSRPAGGDATGSSVDASGPSPEQPTSTPREATPRPDPPATSPSGGEAEASRAPLHFEQPEHVRGLYLNAWVAGSARRLDTLLALARRTEINTFVIDIKDATGYVSHPTKVPLAVAAGADGEVRIHDLRGLLVKLKRAGIYPIARIVVIKDPILVKYRPDLAVQDTAGGVWVDDKGIVWLNLFDKDVWKYHVALAEEVASYGFPEIQWDYVRFPDAPKSDLARAVFPDSAGLSKPLAIRDFLEYSRKELAKKGVRVTADVFGVTASASRDVGIGQVWKSFIDAVDVAMPMVYPSHYWEGSFGFETPNAYPYEVVHHALTDALRQSAEVKGAGATRPWLQDFTLGKPPYGSAEVRAEIQATYDAGIHSWILWNPSSHYTESALQPVGGFETEPGILVDGRVVPVSKRFAALAQEEARADSAAAAARAADTAVSTDTVRAGAASMGADSATVATDSTLVGADSAVLGADTARVDTTASASVADTLRYRRPSSRSYRRF